MIMILTANDTHSHEELFRFELEFDLKTFGQNTFCIIGTSLAHPRNAMMHGVLPWNALVHICEWTENPCGFVRSVDESSSKSTISPPIFVDSDSGESSMTYACKFQRQESGQKKHNFLVVRLWKTEPHLHHCAVQRHLRQKLNVTKNERIGYSPRLGRAIPSSTLADHWSAKAYRTGEANIELRHCFLNFLKHAPNNRHP